MFSWGQKQTKRRPRKNSDYLKKKKEERERAGLRSSWMRLKRQELPFGRSWACQPGGSRQLFASINRQQKIGDNVIGGKGLLVDQEGK